MLRLLKIELQKYLSYTNFWVIIGLHSSLFILSLFIGSQINIDIPGLDFTTFVQFPTIWNTVSWIASWFNLLLAILLIAFIGNEYSFKTFRQNVIDGLSRSELIISKLLVIIVLSIYCFVLVSIVTIAMGLILSTHYDFSIIFSNAGIMFVYFIQTIAYMTFGMFLAILVKNTALSIVFYFLYFFPIEPIVRNLFPDQIGMFFPMKVISNLTPAPEIFNFTGQAQFQTTINGQIQQQMPTQLPVEDASMTLNLIVAIAYILIFSYGSYFVMKRKSL
ncbi:MAG TPA: hypothetical protein DDX39_10835 [Bacteroidales bacterium]|nr:MAG: hypothetical protein A2W98_13225 [Bacteroidetes bacterium GWF2_33_38]OFY73538.1 MAG: hypothetical protein A2265_00610 [Bacteroidetes bacterium RIFOXYA12_FULL_33_9]OFY89220.1 MAG: hypothetical protein A2236_09985 [Bacteroidetes bacterium RIFOXYA2_FULL_33_7]HBF89127.1 hypothetical protein [Bacteroidales bacterium]